MQGVARPNVRRQDRWPVDRYLPHHGVARRLGVLLTILIGRRIARKPRVEDGQGAPPGPNPCSTAVVRCRLLSLFVGASSTTEGLERQARKRLTQSYWWSRRSPSPV